MEHRYIKFKGISIEQGRPYLLQAVSDETSGSANKTTINYYGYDGAEYRDILYLPREFSVDGVILADNDNDMVLAQRKLISKCDLKSPFKLEYFNRNRRLFATAYLSSLPTFQTRVGWTIGFTLHFVIPSFYWEGYEINSKLSDITNNVVSQFTLPAVFTSTSGDGTVTNKGDVETYPVITVTFTAASTGFTITNNGTNKMELSTSFAENDVLIIDMSNRTITNNDIIIVQDISLDSEFWALEVGSNSIVPSTESCNVAITYRERFL